MSDPAPEEVFAALRDSGEASYALEFQCLEEYFSSEDRAKVMKALSDLDIAHSLRETAEFALKDTFNFVESRIIHKE